MGKTRPEIPDTMAQNHERRRFVTSSSSRSEPRPFSTSVTPVDILQYGYLLRGRPRGLWCPPVGPFLDMSKPWSRNRENGGNVLKYGARVAALPTNDQNSGIVTTMSPALKGK